MPPALTKDNSTTIGFVVSCLFAEAINKQELQAWADHILVTTETCPLYIIDLSSFDEAICNIYEFIGFGPCSGLSDAERDALVGIACLRGVEPFEPEPSRDQAFAALAAHPSVLARFRDTFPFIHLPPALS